MWMNAAEIMAVLKTKNELRDQREKKLEAAKRRMLDRMREGDHMDGDGLVSYPKDGE